MLKSERIFVKSNCVKPETSINVLDFVTSLIRNTELRKILDNKDYKNGKDLLEKSIASADVLTLENTEIQKVLGNDAGEFIKKRDEVVALKKELETCVPFDQITSLPATDKTHIYLIAHTCYKQVRLDALDLFDTEKGGVDISKSIISYYKSGKLKDIKEQLRPVFNKLMGTEGEYFYAFKPKRSDFSDEDLRHFMAYFGNKANSPKIKKKVDGKEIIDYGEFDWVNSSENKKVQIEAFTNLMAVVMSCAKKHEVVKPEPVAELPAPEKSEN